MTGLIDCPTCGVRPLSCTHCGAGVTLEDLGDGLSPVAQVMAYGKVRTPRAPTLVPHDPDYVERDDRPRRRRRQRPTAPPEGRVTAAVEALEEAADFLEGGLDVAGIPRDLYEFRLWLRARAEAVRARAAIAAAREDNGGAGVS